MRFAFPPYGLRATGSIVPGKGDLIVDRGEIEVTFAA
jgi:hypothetical protein